MGRAAAAGAVAGALAGAAPDDAAIARFDILLGDAAARPAAFEGGKIHAMFLRHAPDQRRGMDAFVEAAGATAQQGPPVQPPETELGQVLVALLSQARLPALASPRVPTLQELARLPEPMPRPTRSIDHRHKSSVSAPSALREP